MASAGRLSKCKECGRRTVGYAVVTMRDGARRHFCYECGPTVQRRESDAANQDVALRSAELRDLGVIDANMSAPVEVAEVVPETEPATAPEFTFNKLGTGYYGVVDASGRYLGTVERVYGAWVSRRLAGDEGTVSTTRIYGARHLREVADREATYSADELFGAKPELPVCPVCRERAELTGTYTDDFGQTSIVCGYCAADAEWHSGEPASAPTIPGYAEAQAAISKPRSAADAAFAAAFAVAGALSPQIPDIDFVESVPVTLDSPAVCADCGAAAEWFKTTDAGARVCPACHRERGRVAFAPETEEVETVEQPTAAPAMRFTRTVNGHVYSVRIADYSDFAFRAGANALTFGYEVRIHHTPLRAGGGVTIKPATVLRSVYGPRVESREAALRGAGAVIATHAGVAEAYEYGASGEVVGIFPEYTAMCSGCGDDITGRSNAIDESGWLYCVSCFESRRAAMLAAAEPEWLPEAPAPAVELACSDCGRTPSVLFTLAGVHVCSDCVKHRVEAMATAVRGAGAQVAVSVAEVGFPRMDAGARRDDRELDPILRMEALQLSGERRYRESLLGDDADTAEDYAYSSATNYGAW